MSVKANKELVRRLVKEFWSNLTNLAVADELLAPDFIFNYAPPNVKPNREVYKQVMSAYAVGFPDFHVTIEDMVAEGDKVAIRTTNRATNTGSFMGMPPTGKKTEVPQTSIFRIVDSKIIAEWTVANQLIAMQQMGLIPPMGKRQTNRP
ncbi:MAG: ester cyclase, partial [Candidatus Bathyarchaeota archaeon]